VESSLSPLQVLHSTQAIERAMGRTKKSETINPESETVLYSDRCIDIDIIRVFDGEKELFVDLPELHIPHLLWQERDFVKVPLAEIMPV
jgi:2-amino-4-hydroxy-6-hydroxymethyldihydropteridine diphosphokinase